MEKKRMIKKLYTISKIWILIESILAAIMIIVGLITIISQSDSTLFLIGIALLIGIAPALIFYFLFSDLIDMQLSISLLHEEIEKQKNPKKNLNTTVNKDNTIPIISEQKKKEIEKEKRDLEAKTEGKSWSLNEDGSAPKYFKSKL